MKTVLQKRLGFIARSLAWSLLLYVALMLAFNWDEVKCTVQGRRIAVVAGDQDADAGKGAANIDHETGMLHNMLVVIKNVSGIIAFAQR